MCLVSKFRPDRTDAKQRKYRLRYRIFDTSEAILSHLRASLHCTFSTVRRPLILGPPVCHRLTRPRRFLVVSLAKRATGPIQQLVGIVLAWLLRLSRIGGLH